MVPDPTKTSLGLEYFCLEGDELWRRPDAELVELGKREVERIGLARYAEIEGGCVLRIPKAYPVYDSGYREYLEVVRKFVDGLDNFQTIGRNGLHRYNNQDHAMLTGMLAVRNSVLRERNDLWSVNTDQEYHEEVLVGSGITEDEALELLQDALKRVFLKLDRIAFGLSLGTVVGVLLCLMTLALALKGGEVIGPNLQLLGQYFPGYKVNVPGSVLGLVYGFLSGFIGGWVFALLRNTFMFLNMAGLHRRAERGVLGRLFDYL